MDGETVTERASTLIACEVDLLLSATDVAVTLTVRFAATVAGAVYVAEPDVTFDSEPQAAPVQPVPVRLQVTPLPEESLMAVPVRLTVCP